MSQPTPAELFEELLAAIRAGVSRNDVAWNKECTRLYERWLERVERGS